MPAPQPPPPTHTASPLLHCLLTHFPSPCVCSTVQWETGPTINDAAASGGSGGMKRDEYGGLGHQQQGQDSVQVRPSDGLCSADAICPLQQLLHIPPPDSPAQQGGGYGGGGGDYPDASGGYLPRQVGGWAVWQAHQRREIPSSTLTTAPFVHSGGLVRILRKRRLRRHPAAGAPQ